MDAFDHVVKWQRRMTIGLGAANPLLTLQMVRFSSQTSCVAVESGCADFLFFGEAGRRHARPFEITTPLPCIVKLRLGPDFAVPVDDGFAVAGAAR